MLWKSICKCIGFEVNFAGGRLFSSLIYWLSAEKLCSGFLWIKYKEAIPNTKTSPWRTGIWRGMPLIQSHVSVYTQWTICVTSTLTRTPNGTLWKKHILGEFQLISASGLKERTASNGIASSIKVLKQLNHQQPS